MKRLMEQVQDFHAAGGLSLGEDLPEHDADTAMLDALGRQLQASAKDLAWQGKGSRALRARLMLEELGETLVAMSRGDLVETADGLADLAYVVVGTAVTYRIPLSEVVDVVHVSNMSKFPTCETCGGFPDGCETCGGLGCVVELDDTGKVVKPDSFVPADVDRLLRQAGLLPAQCRATTLLAGEGCTRSEAVRQCELDAGHDGDHQHPDAGFWQ